MEQLIFLAIFLVAALLDLLVRWLRGKTKESASRDDQAILEEDTEAQERSWLEQQERAERQLAELERAELERAELERAQLERAQLQRAQLERVERELAERQWAERPRRERVPAELPPPFIRAPALEEIAARRPVKQPRASPSHPSALTSRTRRRSGARQYIAGPAHARQAIIGMTILGRCRGLE